MSMEELAKRYRKQTVCWCCYQRDCSCHQRMVEDIDHPGKLQAMCFTHGKVHLGSGISMYFADGDVVLVDQDERTK